MKEPNKLSVDEIELVIRKQVHDIVNGLTHPNVAIDEILKVVKAEYAASQATVGQQVVDRVYVPCDENDSRCIGGFTSHDGQSLCYVREVYLTSPAIVNQICYKTDSPCKYNCSGLCKESF